MSAVYCCTVKQISNSVLQGNGTFHKDVLYENNYIPQNLGLFIRCRKLLIKQWCEMLTQVLKGRLRIRFYALSLIIPNL